MDGVACGVAALHGACGQAFRNGSPLVVADVADLGENYVACDPRDRSELVLPLFEPDGRCWGVLDLDSFEVGSFSKSDTEGLLSVLIAADLTSR